MTNLSNRKMEYNTNMHSTEDILCRLSVMYDEIQINFFQMNQNI